MEVVQGKPNDKKIVFAQEIAFAKVLAGNNKTLRDRALKKLKKWLTIRGNGRWAFTEEEFLRIWTGLFYCMWMSDKFLIQEELAESISSLIHCFKKNSQSALLFIKCFNKRVLMDWEGLDQYRIDKFNMLVRRFLRQTFVYIKEKDWEESLLQKLMGIFFNVVLHRDNSLGFVLHFISIYNEELAKVSKGKLSTSTVLTLIEPFVKLIARSKDSRILKETEDFFIYLMRQTDTGIEFEEKFNAWRQLGFPGEGPHCLVATPITNKKNNNDDDDDVSEDEQEIREDDNDDNQDEPLDPRAGSVHVYLPQIPVDVEGFLNLFKKLQNSKYSTNKGRKLLKSLIQKYGALKRGRFPQKIKKDPVLDEKLRKKKLPLKNAKKLLEFTEQLNKDPIQSKDFSELSKQLEEQCDSNSEDEEELVEFENEIEEPKQLVRKTKKQKQKLKKINNNMKEKTKMTKKVKISKESLQDVKENQNHKENGELQKKKKNKKKKKIEGETNEEVVKIKKNKINGMTNGLHEKPVKKAERKRKILSNWQVKELDTSSPEYYKIKTPKIIRLEKKINVDCDSCHEENGIDKVEETMEEKTQENEETTNDVVIPQFWQKAKEKVDKKSKSKDKLYLNPFAKLQNEYKSPGRRISFALDKNMAQENEQYLEEVKNSPKVPFDGSKKPVQSALKSGLAPSPVNPFYRIKKIKF